MAEQENNGRDAKAQAVRESLAALGKDASLKEVEGWLKTHKNMTISPPTFYRIRNAEGGPAKPNGRGRRQAPKVEQAGSAGGTSKANQLLNVLGSVRHLLAMVDGDRDGLKGLIDQI